MDYGAAASQPGKDVKITADRFFTLSSSFQSLKVLDVEEVSTTIPGSGTNTITITHNLGYFAPVIVVYNGSTTIGTSQNFLMSDNLIPLDIEIHENSIKINVDDLFNQGFSVTGDTVYFTVYSFLDTFDTFVAPVLSADTADQADGADYGFRISKPGFDVKNCADVDCIITSKRPSMTVHMKGIDTTGTVAHGLGYIPTYFSFVKFDGDDFLSNFGTFLTSVNATNLEWDATTDSLYYIIFKSRTV